MSQRALTEGNRAERKAFTLANLEEGQVLDGEVRRLTNFGAFVDIGGVDGLLHVKDMRWKRVDHPRDVVDVGDVVQVKVLRFDLDSEKISLGTKQLLPDPWVDAESRYRPQVEVSGHVVGLTEFGAFVMLDDGIEARTRLRNGLGPKRRESDRFSREGSTTQGQGCSIRHRTTTFGFDH